MTPRAAACQASLSYTASYCQSLLSSSPLSRWYYLTISSSVALFFSCLQSFPASGSFPVSQFFAIPRTVACWAPLSFTISQSLLKLMSIELVIPSNHLILCHPLLLLPSIFLRVKVVSNESVLHIRWPKYWSFSLSICPSSDYSGLISFRID